MRFMHLAIQMPCLQQMLNIIFNNNSFSFHQVHNPRKLHYEMIDFSIKIFHMYYFAKRVYFIFFVHYIY